MEEKTTQDIPSKRLNVKLSVIGLVLSLICLFSSIASLNTFILKESNCVALSATAGYFFFTIWPVVGLFALSIAFNAFNLSNGFKTKEKAKINKEILFSITGLIISAFCIALIPVAFRMISAKATEACLEEKAKTEEMPSVTRQLKHYSDCFSRMDDSEFIYGLIYARDAICGYLRYTYSNNWQEPKTAPELIKSGYVPEYFRDGSDYYKSHNRVVLGISSYIHNRDSIGQDGIIIITPHQTCSKEDSDSIISAWFITDAHDTTDEEDLACLYYDYRTETDSADLEHYKDTSINIYSNEFEDMFKIILKKLRDKRGSQDFNYTISINESVYDNAIFMESFLSSLPE